MKQNDFNEMMLDFLDALVIYRYIILFFGFAFCGFMLIEGVL